MAISTGAFIAGSLGAAALSAGGSLGSAALNSKWTYNQMQTQHDYELENMRAQQAWQEKMYQRSFEDSSPATQRRLMEVAGYNPYELSDGSPVATGQIPSSGSPSTSVSPQRGPFDNLGASVGQSLEALTALANWENVNQDTEGKRIENVASGLQLEYLGTKLQNEIEMQQVSIDNLLSSSRLSDASRENLLKQKEYLGTQLEVLQGQKDALIKQPSLMNEQIQSQTAFVDAQRITENLLRDSKLKNLQVNTASLAFGMKEAAQRISLMSSQIDLNSKQGKALLAQEAKAVADANLTNLNVDLKKQFGSKEYDALIRQIEAGIIHLGNQNAEQGIQFGPFKLGTYGRQSNYNENGYLTVPMTPYSR